MENEIGGLEAGKAHRESKTIQSVGVLWRHQCERGGSQQAGRELAHDACPAKDSLLKRAVRTRTEESKHEGEGRVQRTPG